jgi:hypothetical protein
MWSSGRHSVLTPGRPVIWNDHSCSFSRTPPDMSQRVRSSRKHWPHVTTQNSETTLKTNHETNTFLICKIDLSEQLDLISLNFIVSLDTSHDHIHKGLFRVWPGLQSTEWPLLVLLYVLPSEPGIGEELRCLRFNKLSSLCFLVRQDVYTVNLWVFYFYGLIGSGNWPFF